MKLAPFPGQKIWYFLFVTIVKEEKNALAQPKTKKFAMSVIMDANAAMKKRLNMVIQIVTVTVAAIKTLKMMKILKNAKFELQLNTVENKYGYIYEGFWKTFDTVKDFKAQKVLILLLLLIATAFYVKVLSLRSFLCSLIRLKLVQRVVLEL